MYSFYTILCYEKKVACLLCPFSLAILLSVLLRCTTYDYPFGIFKHFSNSDGQQFHQHQQNFLHQTFEHKKDLIWDRYKIVAGLNQ
jgi:hypothetical protein